MKTQRKWAITTGENLKVKKHTIVMTKIPNEKRIEEKEILSSNHVSVEEDEEKSQLKDVQEASTSFGKESSYNQWAKINQH